MKILNLKQGSPEWLNARKGVITGTHVKTVMGRTSKDFIYKLIADQVSPLQFNYVSEAMEHGTLYEDEAIDKYEIEKGIITEKVDFCIHKDRFWHGLSPDRLVSKKKKYIGGVEAKCPSPKVHLKYIDSGKIPSQYKWQVVNYFLVNEDCEWLDFVSYCPEIEIPKLKLFIKRVTRKGLKDSIKMADKKLLAFREKWKEIENKLLF